MSLNSTENTMRFFATSENGPHNSTAAYSHEVVLLISIAAGLCSLITVVGNVIVILSFFINKSLRNFSNYMILSLAFSDVTIGAFSMNVFTTYNVNQSWTLGPAMCKAWLSVDYTASNASVMNLLVICVDRYLAITKPVKYRRWCTPRSAAMAIIGVWTLSFLMWVPAITLWDLFSEKNATIADNECYIPFINDSAALSVATIIGAFYFPAFLMCALYQRVIHKIRRRRRGLRSIIRNASAAMAEKRREMKQSDKKQLKNKSPGNEINNVPKNTSNPQQNQSPGDAIAKEKLLNVYEVMKKRGSYAEISEHNPGSSSTVQSRLSLLENSKKECAEVSCDLGNGDLKPMHKTECFQRTLSLQVPSRRQNHNFATKGRSYSCYSAEPSQETSRRTSDATPRESQRAIRERRVTVLLKFILLCFILLWLPYSLIVIIAAICPTCPVPAFMWNLSYWLCYLNSTVNPFCYGFCNENFRRTFKAIITTKWWTPESRKMLRLGRKSTNSPAARQNFPSRNNIIRSRQDS